METSNGFAKGPDRLTKLNGAKNGVLNGGLNGKAMNGHAVGRRRTPTPRRGPTLLGGLFSMAARLLTWYSIITILFRCPATLEACDESSPKICKSYFQVKHTVAPHLEPYYDAYAAPYVEAVQPYYNTLDRTVIAPTKTYVVKYGGPRLTQARAYGQARWEKTIQPQLQVYQRLVRDQYDQSLAPHVNKASETMSPYLDIARTNALQTYHELLLPTYEVVRPYAATGYTLASAYALDTAVPSAYWAWNKTYIFLDELVWPQIRVIYSQSVEPQLSRIGRRLGRFKDKANTSSVPDLSGFPDSEALESTVSKSSFAKPSPSASSSTIKSAVTESSTVIQNIPTPDVASEDFAGRGSEPIQAPPAGESESESRKIAREAVAEDLEQWQAKFTKAADESAAEIEARVEEISKQMIEQNANQEGKPLVIGLQKVAQQEVEKLKLEIVRIIEGAGESSEDTQEALNNAVRTAGVAIKREAQGVRLWKQKYDAETETAVTKAAENHFRILDGIRDLALQKIGMKWAWMDGVTYKDWAKYHQLRDKFSEWIEDLKDLVVTHPDLGAAQEAAADVEDAAMAVAQAAAQELGRLKQVAAWKLTARDASDNFESEALQAAAEEAEKQRAAASATSTPEEDPLESAVHVIEDESPATDLPESAPSAIVSDVAGKIKDQAESATDAATSVAESLISVAAESASSAASEGTVLAGKVVSEASDAAAAAFDSASKLVSGTPVADQAVQGTDLASTVVSTDDHSIVANDTSTSPVDEDAPEAGDDEDAADAEYQEAQRRRAAETPVKASFLGAAADFVPSRQPILDDYTDTDSIASSAQEAYSNAVGAASEKYSSALSAASVQIYGTPKPAHEEIFSSISAGYNAAVASASAQLGDASEKYSSAMSAASVKLYGTPKPAHQELFSSISAGYSAAVASASAKLGDALGAAQSLVATPTTKSVPTFVDWSKIEEIAGSRLSEGRAWAESQYESAKVAVGLATATPTGTVNKLLEQARYNYYAGLGVAHARYAEFISAASSALSSVTATPTPTDIAGTASSLAAVASASASSALSAAGDNAASAASIASENASSIASVVGDTVSSAAVAASEQVAAVGEQVAAAAAGAGESVSDTWDSLVNHLSAQVYGQPTPTPWYESAFSAVGDYAAAATEAVVGGMSAMTNTGSEYAASAADEATKQYEVVSSIIQELIVGKEPTFSESVLSRLQAAYVTGASSASSFISAASSTAASVVGDATAAAGSAAAAGADTVKAAAEQVGSAASSATDAAKKTVKHARDEL